MNLKEFLKTGRLGPIHMGMNPLDVINALGEPTFQSRKLNPLLLHYGPLKLTFVRQSPQAAQGLRDIIFEIPESGCVRSDHWMFAEVDPASISSESKFINYLHRIDIDFLQSQSNGVETKLNFLSGVSALFVEGKLRTLGLSQRRALRETPSSHKEPTIREISEMLEEANVAKGAGIMSAALLLAWAGIEALLRKGANAIDPANKIGVSPLKLLQDLQAAQQISPIEFERLEMLRRARTAVAHGLAPKPVTSEMISEALNLAGTLLSRIRGLGGIAHSAN